MRVLVIQNEPREGPGSILAWARSRGHELSVVPTWEPGLPSPLALVSRHDGLILLGGEANVCDADRHPWMSWARSLLHAAFARQMPCLGICLGGQLVADALGAKIFPLSVPALGAHPVSFAPPFPSRLSGEYLHWNSWNFELPSEGRPIARAEACPNPGFSVAHRIHALQFHPEWTPAAFRALLHERGHTPPPPENPLRERLRSQAMSRRCALLMDRLLGHY